ncbi:hypothetical protein H9L39_17328 [Fusarium oxysporum f. sp. albedinis]|nr:hypothetical protein H9L39_17328 [Fusarium oxysporum f. sp. albedinis]
MRDEETQERLGGKKEEEDEEKRRWRSKGGEVRKRWQKVVSKCTVMATPDRRQPVNRCHIIP